MKNFNPNQLSFNFVCEQKQKTFKTPNPFLLSERVKKIKKACELLDIQLLDHVIMTTDAYFSFADTGEL